MPKDPITARTILWEKLEDDTLRILEWCVVTTSLGDMVEARTVTKQTGAMQNENLLDSSATAITVLPRVPTGHFALDEASVSTQWPHYRATTPGGLN